MGHNSTQMGKSYHEITRDYISKLEIFQLQAFTTSFSLTTSQPLVTRRVLHKCRYYMYTNSGASVAAIM